MGICFTLIIAAAGYSVAKQPGFNHIGPLASAIFIAIVYRHFWGYPEQLRSGIQFSAKTLLRLAIILFGLKLNVGVIFSQGIGLLGYGAVSIAFSILSMLIIAKILKADRDMSLLLGVGTGVCGAAAIAAVSPILKSKDGDTAIGVGLVALVGTVFSVCYTLLQPLLPLSISQYAAWSGLSLHELAHVALATAPAGQDALALGLLAKLGRVLLLVPLSLILMYVMKYVNKEQSASKVEFPWFLIGFIIMSVIGSTVLGKHIIVAQNIMDNIANFTTIILTMAMVGLGLNVDLHNLRAKALKPLIAMTITSVLLSSLTYLLLS